MSDTIRCYVNKYFCFLSEEFAFSKSDENYDGHYFEAKFYTNDICIRLEKYRRELYLYLSKSSNPEEEVNLFSLVEFINRNTKENVKSNYFPDEKDLKECYRMQIEWMSDVLRTYLPGIRDFFSDTLYSENIAALRDYVIKMHPDLYAKW